MPSRTAKSAASSKRGELALIRQIRSRAQIRSRTGKSACPGLALGIGDDCALLRPRPGREFAVTTDLCIDGRHFRLDWHTPESIGHRALARGLSDLAAMGAETRSRLSFPGFTKPAGQPAGPLVSLLVARFFDGLLALAADYKTPLAGGDLSETPVPLADIVLIGSVPAGKALLRSTARPGDLLYVTGTWAAAPPRCLILTGWLNKASPAPTA